MRPDDDLAHFSPILHHSSPILSVLAPGSRTARKNGEKTAENGAETAEKEWLGQVDLPYRQPMRQRCVECLAAEEKGAFRPRNEWVTQENLGPKLA